MKHLMKTLKLEVTMCLTNNSSNNRTKTKIYTLQQVAVALKEYLSTGTMDLECLSKYRLLCSNRNSQNQQMQLVKITEAVARTLAAWHLLEPTQKPLPIPR